MQTLSRYFVAFLLLLVSSFLEEQEAENQTQHASLQSVEIIIEHGPDTKNPEFYFRCS
ncbi:MAG: hypothetical protein HKN89_04055 [Eudoraea sp.]|nr:hypothetical protein [Eudoraea sp.]